MEKESISQGILIVIAAFASAFASRSLDTMDKLEKEWGLFWGGIFLSFSFLIILITIVFVLNSISKKSLN